MTSITKDAPRRALRRLRDAEREHEDTGHRVADAREQLDAALGDAGWHRLSGLLSEPIYSSDAGDTAGLAGVLARLGVGA
jgi:hypothetical protein